ncbi:LPS export ABC transporter periplasmic protein LptC [Bermanella marisrubri]|uniref:Lipopolysaccharide export system protein LptC n=1 Tax=Bermanella marisrubri TaxID=207949 RepID=Q1MYN0_9GAMM|nr:LPS export ABC transporter periplasmic protein LptC [Bermanella marisrubri]EAT11086.1 hypothetical protein RED65_07604 [Oceanobacter sp. RED65] [Bermanella marisrubri]QIZ83413.1 LPS export ABC transporter periplasmic protein LptC [Bermanella marisrubri]
MRKRYIATILIALTVVAYMALNDRQGEEYHDQEQAKLEPDFMVENLNLQNYGENGELRQTVKAKSAKHFPATDVQAEIVAFISPDITLHQADKKLWRLTAETGKLTNQRYLSLSGRVAIKPLVDASTRFSLKTATLNMDLNTQIANTDSDVIIENPNTLIESTGLTLDLKKETVQFISKVRGSHDPSHQ